MDEKERLRRIREQQIADRHPGESKIRGYDWSKHDKKAKRVAAKKRKQQQRALILDLWYALPIRWQGAVLGILFGLVVDIPLLLALPGEWHVMGLVPVLIGAVFGMVLGKTMQEDIL